MPLRLKLLGLRIFNISLSRESYLRISRRFQRAILAITVLREADDIYIYFFFLNKFIYFIYLFLAVLSLRCCVRAFSSCGERGLLFVVVRGLLIAVASLIAEHGL